MDFSVFEALVLSIESEGKLVLDQSKEVLFENQFVLNLRQQLGDCIFQQAVMDCIKEPCTHSGFTFASTLSSQYAIVTVKKIEGKSATVEDTFSAASCLVRLNVIDGTSVGLEVDENYCKLVGVDRETIIQHGIPAVGNQVHPEDLVMSDVFAKDIIARRSRGTWPMRIFVDNVYKWRQYDLCVEPDPESDEFVFMKISMIDYTEQADEMGLVSTPGMKTLELPNGLTRTIPIVHHATTTDLNSAIALDSISSSSTCESVEEDDLANIACLRRYLGSRLIGALSIAMQAPECTSVVYIPLDIDALKEELSLCLAFEDFVSLEDAMARNDFIACTKALSKGMEVDSEWFSLNRNDYATGNIDRITLSFKFLIALASKLPQASDAITLLRGLYNHMPIVSSLGGRNLSLMLQIELVLTLLSVALHPPASHFKVRENYHWLATLLDSVIDCIKSDDGLVLQGLYWISIQWGFLHVAIGRTALARDIWQSTLEDIHEYIQQFPNSATGKKLEQIVTLNISRLS